jgi:hypothetical protein
MLTWPQDAAALVLPLLEKVKSLTEYLFFVLIKVAMIKTVVELKKVSIRSLNLNYFYSRDENIFGASL